MDALSVITDTDIVIKSAHPMSLNFEARVGVGGAGCVVVLTAVPSMLPPFV